MMEIAQKMFDKMLLKDTYTKKEVQEIVKSILVGSGEGFIKAMDEKNKKIEGYDLLINKLLAYTKGNISKKEWKECQDMWGKLS